MQWKYSGDSAWRDLIALSDLKGEKGDPGQDGKDGITPRLKIDDDNFWYVSYDGGQSWISLGVKATGETGAPGQEGKDGKDGRGIAKAEINANGELTLTYTDGTTVNLGKVVGADGKDGQIPFIGENGNWWIGERDTGVKAAMAASAGSGALSAASPALWIIGIIAGLALLGNFGLILYIILKKKKDIV